jgi:RNase P/RNase MRP subunit POP5
LILLLFGPTETGKFGWWLSGSRFSLKKDLISFFSYQKKIIFAALLEVEKKTDKTY